MMVKLSKSSLQVPVRLVDIVTAAAWLAAAKEAILFAAVMSTVVCLRIAVVMLLRSVRSKVYERYYVIKLIRINYHIIELTESILIANQNFVHRFDINSAVSSYRVQTLLSNLKNVISLDYHYR